MRLRRTFLRQFALLLAAFLVTITLSYLCFGHAKYFWFGSSAAVHQIMLDHNRAISTGTRYFNELGMRRINLLRAQSASRRSVQRSKLDHPNMCISIVTRHRKVPYIHALLASLLLGNKPSDVSSVDIHVLNTEDDPQTHTGLDMVAKQLPFVTILNSNSWNRGPKTDWKSRESYDYAAAIESCIQSGAPWVVVLEEDAILTKNFIPKVLQVLKSVKETKTTAFVKLWYSDRWDGYEKQDIVPLISEFIAMGIVVSLICKKLWKLDIASSLLVCAWFALTGLTNTVLIGRQNLTVLRERTLSLGQRLRPSQENHGAGTVAVAYRMQGASRITKHIRDSAVGSDAPPLDVSLSKDYLRRYKHLIALEVAHPLAQHIGAFSSSNDKNNGSFDWLGQNVMFTDGVL